jgi:hypothetical protein
MVQYSTEGRGESSMDNGELLNDLPVAVFAIEVGTWCVRDTNHAAEDILEVPRNSIVGDSLGSNSHIRGDARRTGQRRRCETATETGHR